jgi:8-oxo-dGTP pyrophosphatase MutT (NUDIX family)
VPIGSPVNDKGIPQFLRALERRAKGITATDLSRFVPPETGGRPSAVLILFGVGASGPDVLLVEKAPELRSHAGQPAFPGGSMDAGDADPVATALREAEEETGLDPSGVAVLAVLPDLWVPPSGFVVTPVLGWWRAPSPVWPADPGEIAAVHRVPIAELIDPANRVTVRHPSGFVGPAFRVRGLLVWGFTAGLLDRLLDLAGWSIPWGPGPEVTFPVVDEPR